MSTRADHTHSDTYGNAYGQFQTINSVFYGPLFGGGIDLSVSSSLADGGVLQYSYGTGGPCAYGYGGENIFGTSYLTSSCGFTYAETGFTVGALEVYTFTPNAAPLPDTGNTLTLFGIAALGVAACRRYVARS